MTMLQICQVDDVLDSVRALHVRGDSLRRVPLLDSVLLRDKDHLPHLASLPRHQGLLSALQEVRPPAAIEVILRGELSVK